MAHERAGYISTSGLKSDVTVMFLDGGAENAGVKNAAPDCRDGKRGTRLQGWKMREWKSMESQKSPLFNIVTSVLQQPLELM